MNQNKQNTEYVAYVPAFDKVLPITAWLGKHVIVDLGYEKIRLTATVAVKEITVFSRMRPYGVI